MHKISVILADEQHLFRLGLRKLLESQANLFEVLAEATNERQLLGLLKEHKPDVVIIDHKQGENFRTATLETIRRQYPQVRILVISADNDKSSIHQILAIGVANFVTKTCSTDEVVNAALAAARGNKFFCTRVIDYLLERSLAPLADEDTIEAIPLSPREIEIVQLSSKGLIAKEIADMLNLSTHTVYTHKKNLMKKLGFNSNSELMLYAINKGLINNE